MSIKENENREALEILLLEKDQAKHLEEIKALLPALFNDDGDLDFGKLSKYLTLNLEPKSELYQFNWQGKSQAKLEAFKPCTKHLVIDHTRSLKPAFNNSKIIEGDNLDALKLLSHEYKEKIKCIYIDPPYNKDKEFVYTDTWKQDKQSYRKDSGLANEPANAELSGRYHSKWLSMMYPRLLLARTLLKDVGVICISISDEEVHHVRILCDEIFGEQNFEGHIHWRRRHNQPNDKNKMIGLVAEHVIVYSKDKQALKRDGVGKVDLTGDFSNPDNDPRGSWASKPWKVASNQSGTRYVIKNPYNNKEYDEVWMGEEATYHKLLEDNRIYFSKRGSGLPRKKYFRIEREAEGQCANNWWSHEQFGHNQGANAEMTDLFGHKNIFTNPKPKELIRGLMQIANVKGGDVVLDFFAGSGVVGQVVMELNEEDDQKRTFILVQRPEEIAAKMEAYKLGYRNISDITIARNQKAIAQLQRSNETNVNTSLRTKNENLNNLGFKVYKIE